MIKFLSRLPMRALYALSTFLYLLAFYVVRHRHQVICEQIEKVYPQSSPAERRRIHKQFLKNFCDVMVEVLKSVSMTDADMRARVQILNLDQARRYLDGGQSVMFVTSHLCNWEWLLHGVTLQLGYPVDAAYKPLHDQWAERLMLRIRSRFGARLVPAKELLADFLQRRGIVRAVAMNADQAPVSWVRTPRSTSAPSKLRVRLVFPSYTPRCAGCGAGFTKCNSYRCGMDEREARPTR
jgi:KDO2-lipid IV(A) lauroyltransferase